jgi:hypothetical protein
VGVKEVIMAVLTPTPLTAAPKDRKPRAVRRFGYVVAALVNALMLFAVNRWPGWDAVPFLTDDTEQVLPWVNASIVTGLVVNLLYLGYDRRWFRSLGDVVTTAVSTTAMLRIWDVFPLDLSEGWETVARVLLALGLAGTLIAFAVALVAFVRAVGKSR